MSRGALWKVTWGAAFVNTLNGGYPLLDVSTWSEPADGSELERSAGGTVDGWVTRHRYLLRGSVGWIPTTDTTDPVATGWDGTGRWEAFLEWIREGNVARFYPDRVGAPSTYQDVTLVSPFKGGVGLEDDDNRRVTLTLESTTRFTGF